MALYEGNKGEDIKEVMILVGEEREKCCEYCRMMEKYVKDALEMIENHAKINFHLISLVKKEEKLEKLYIDEESIRKCNPEWVCPACTYKNSENDNTCQMCGCPKPSN